MQTQFKNRQILSRLAGYFWPVFAVLLLAAVSLASANGQTAGALRGQITDPSGASVPSAAVTLTGPTVKVVETNVEGKFSIAQIPPGTYTVRVMAKGFNLFEKQIAIAAGQSLNLTTTLTVQAESQQIVVTDQARVEVDPSQNASQLILKGEDLEALSDNPDDLAADLQALAGPSAGPNGGQIYIDGFTGGRLPPKESIREIRINQNPFSAEYDRLGFGRIEVFTKPGTDKFRGQAFFNFGDAVLNARNPYSTSRPSYQQKFFGGNLSGPVTKKASFFIDAERRQQDEVSVINAITLDPNFNAASYTNAILNPSVRTTLSPRFDLQLSPKHSLTTRYTWAQTTMENEGLDAFSLPSRAYNVDNTQHTLQLTETWIIGPKAINETRFQYIGQRSNRLGDNSTPGIQVLDAFSGGGASVGLAYGDENRYELFNSTSLTLGKHLTKMGARMRWVDQSDFTTQNYNGQYTFSSLDAYRITLQGLAAGWSPVQIRAAGGGANQFSITSGQSLASVRQHDLGAFIQDDWRLRPNFTLSTGLRLESQNNIANKLNVAPRVGFAWGLGKKTVVRGGLGFFFDRFGEDLVLQARRQDGINQVQYLAPQPDFYPAIPTAEELAANPVTSTVRSIDSSLHAPYVIQSALGIERQLPKNVTVSVNWTSTRGLHELRSRNINAPLSGVRPYGDTGNRFQYESTGTFRQNQLMTNINARISPKISMFGFYVYGRSFGNSSGAGGFPSDNYDLSSEYGRTQFDVRHRLFIGGSVSTPYGIRLSPFVTANSGAPFNITLGRDLNGDGLFMDRPAFATDLAAPGVVVTQWGAFDTRPGLSSAIIPRNLGEGPAQFTVNLRASRTWGFGERATTAAGPQDGMMRGPGRGGPPPGGGGMRGGGMRGGGGPGGPGGMFGEASGKRYSITLSASARNLLNRVNPASPIGTLSSPLFGTSNSLAGGFGSTATANRRIEFQLRFSF